VIVNQDKQEDTNPEKDEDQERHTEH